MFQNKNQIFFKIKITISLLVGLATTLILAIFNICNIWKVFAASSIATFIVLNFMIFALKNVVKKNIDEWFNFSIFTDSDS